jgi:hypothetical protein
MPVWHWNTFMLLGALAKPVFVGIAAMIAIRELTTPRTSRPEPDSEPVRGARQDHGFAPLFRSSQLN